MDKVEELEAAILERARGLAEGYREQARITRDKILSEAADKLHLREEREVLYAKALAERTYRRRVQSNELKLQARMDRLRWNLVEGVEERLWERLGRLVEDEAAYLPVLHGMIRTAAAALPHPTLVVEVNARDHTRLAGGWGDLAPRLAADKRLTLTDTPLECLGGARVRTPDDHERMDNTFEGRRHRLRRPLQQAIQERLLPAQAIEAGI